MQALNCTGSFVLDANGPRLDIPPVGSIVKEDMVLVDHRTYRVRPGTAQAALDLYEQHGFATQVRHLGKPLAYLITESGELNTLVHLWCYEDATDRAKRRAAMQADPEWKNYLKLSAEAGYYQYQVTQLMIPTKFAAIVR